MNRREKIMELKEMGLTRAEIEAELRRLDEIRIMLEEEKRKERPFWNHEEGMKAADDIARMGTGQKKRKR